MGNWLLAGLLFMVLANLNANIWLAALAWLAGVACIIVNFQEPAK